MGIPRTLGLGVVSFVVITFAVYTIGMWISPPRTSSGHPTMALGHVIIAVFIGGVAAAIVMVLDRVRQRERREDDMRAIERGEIRSIR